MKLTKQTIIAPSGNRTSTAFLPSGKLVVAQDYGERPQLTVFVEGKPALEVTEALDGAKVSRRMLPHVETSASGDVFVSYKTGTKGMPAANQKYRGVWLLKIGADGKTKFAQALGEIAGNGQVQVATDGIWVMGRDGLWAWFDGALNVKAQGRWPLGDSGEKCQFRIGVDRCMNTMMNGYAGYPSRFNSDSLIAADRQPLMVFSDKAFPSMGDDLCHPGLGVDRVNPKRAFVGSVFEDTACLRIITPTGKLARIKRFAASMEPRHGPQMVPKPNGGCLCLFNRKGTVMVTQAAFGRNQWGAAVPLCLGRYASGAFSPSGKLTVVAQTGQGLVRYDFE